MDGVHLAGNCHFGVIKNLKGATNDDLVALNADDQEMFEMSRGPITDIEVDGIFSEDGYSAVRLLSAGSKISRIRMTNIYGNYRMNAVFFSHHNLHPGEASVFEDIIIDGVFCSKSKYIFPMKNFEFDSAPCPLIWMAPGTTVKTLHINNIIRNENFPGSAAGTITVDEGAVVEYMGINNATIINNTNGEINLLNNYGTIEALNIVNVYGKAVDGVPRGFIINGYGVIKHKNITNVIIDNLNGIESDNC